MFSDEEKKKTLEMLQRVEEEFPISATGEMPQEGISVQSVVLFFYLTLWCSDINLKLLLLFPNSFVNDLEEDLEDRLEGLDLGALSLWNLLILNEMLVFPMYEHVCMCEKSMYIYRQGRCWSVEQANDSRERRIRTPFTRRSPG